MAEITRRNVIMDYQANVRQANANLDTLTAKTNGVDRAFSSAISTAKGLALFEIGKQAILGMGRLSTGALKMAGDFEQSRLQFEQLTGSLEVGTKLLEDLAKLSIETPLESKTLQDGAKSLLNYGIAAEDVVDVSRRLGDLSLGNGQKFLALADAYGKANARVKVTNETLELFANNSVPILDLLAKKLNVSKEEVIDLASKGKINFEILREAIEGATNEGGKFFGAMARQATTFNGLLSTLRDAGSIVVRNFGEAFLPIAKEILPQVIERLFKLADIIKPVASAFANTLQRVIIAIRPGVQALVGAFSSLFDTLGNLVGQIPGFRGFGSLLVGIFNTITNGVRVFVETFSKIASQPVVQSFFSQVAGAIIQIPAVINGAIIAFSVLRDNITNSWELIAIDSKIGLERLKQVFGKGNQEIIDSLLVEREGTGLQNLVDAYKKGFAEISELKLPELAVKTDKVKFDFKGLPVSDIISPELSDADQKKIADNIKKAAENIIELEIQAVGDVFAQEEATARNNARKNIEALVGTPEQVKRQSDLITAELERRIRDIGESRDTFFRELRDSDTAFALQTDAAAEEKLLASEKAAIQQRINERSKLDVGIKEQLRDRVITEEQAAEQIVRNEIEKLKILLSALDLSAEERIALKEKIVDAELNLEKSLLENTKKIDDARIDRIKRIADVYTDLGNEVLSLFDTINQGQLDSIDNQIANQERKIERLVDIEKGATAGQLEREEERLAALQQQREEALQDARQLAAAQIAIDTAAAIPAAIRAILEGFKLGPVAGIAAAISLAATIAAGVIRIKAQLSDVPAFREGTDEFRPMGKKRMPNGEYLASLTPGEMVFTAEQRAEMGNLSRKQVIDLVKMSRAIGHRRADLSNLSQGPGAGANLKKVEDRLERMANRLDRLSIQFNVDMDGFSAGMTTHLDNITNKHRTGGRK